LLLEHGADVHSAGRGLDLALDMWKSFICWLKMEPKAPPDVAEHVIEKVRGGEKRPLSRHVGEA
jgi:hypothetical protein